MSHAVKPPRSALHCQACNTRHDTALAIWRCPCGGLLDIEMDEQFPWQHMRQRPPGLWRYREALPLSSPPVSLGEGQTPLVLLSEAPYHLYMKLDYLLPTGSFKDRGATVLLTKARELGVSSLVEDSSGNAGAAIAAYAAAAGIRASIYVPASAPRTKTNPIALYGANLVEVPGPRDNATTAAWLEAQQSYYASHVWNPFFLEGTKTIAFEVWEQLGQRVPDWVIAPVGHGTLLRGLYQGFRHLQRAGLTTRLPRIVGVQAASCAPLYEAWSAGSPELPEIVPQITQADGIAIRRPPRWRQILHAIADTGGMMVAVTEEEISAAFHGWARKGYLMEPTSAAAPAVLGRLDRAGAFKPRDVVVVPVTGAGSKAALGPELR